MIILLILIVFLPPSITEVIEIGGKPYQKDAITGNYIPITQNSTATNILDHQKECIGNKNCSKLEYYVEIGHKAIYNIEFNDKKETVILFVNDTSLEELSDFNQTLTNFSPKGDSYARRVYKIATPTVSAFKEDCGKVYSLLKDIPANEKGYLIVVPGYSCSKTREGYHFQTYEAKYVEFLGVTYMENGNDYSFMGDYGFHIMEFLDVASSFNIRDVHRLMGILIGLFIGYVIFMYVGKLLWSEAGKSSETIPINLHSIEYNFSGNGSKVAKLVVIVTAASLQYEHIGFVALCFIIGSAIYLFKHDRFIIFLIGKTTLGLSLIILSLITFNPTTQHIRSSKAAVVDDMGLVNSYGMEDGF